MLMPLAGFNYTVNGSSGPVLTVMLHAHGSGHNSFDLLLIR